MKSKIIDDRELVVNLVYNFQSIGKVVVFVHGAFDLLHPGHIEFLTKASEFGDLLLVGVYDDASVSTIRGPHRPILPLLDRMFMLQALSMVNYITPLAHPEHEQVIAQIKPDILAQKENPVYLLNSTYIEKNKGIVRIIEVRSDYSITGIINRIHAPYPEDLLNKG